MIYSYKYGSGKPLIDYLYDNNKLINNLSNYNDIFMLLDKDDNILIRIGVDVLFDLLLNINKDDLGKIYNKD